MGNINVGRWILGGVVAGVVLFVIDFVVNGLILAQQWTDAMTALNLPAMTENVGTLIIFLILSLIVGLVAVWIYAGIRPRFGAGVKTAIFAGLAVWLVGYLVPSLFVMASGVFPAVRFWVGFIGGGLEVALAAGAGAGGDQESRVAGAAGG
jgi:hypothetical protein